MNQSMPIYMDYAASTPLDPRVYAVMRPWMEGCPGNPSSHQNPHGQAALAAMLRARTQVAQAIGAQPEEIIFTSGATEANNMALLGMTDYLEAKGQTHIVSTPIEHASIAGALSVMRDGGFDVALCRLLPCGMADGPLVLNEITAQTGMVSVQAVNNETGVINPLSEVKDGIADKDILFHADAAQALGKCAFNVKECGVDMATLSGHKLYGPQGIGALYIRKDLQPYMRPLFHGGGQQSGLRSGTLPVALIAGFGEACVLAAQVQESEKTRLEGFHELFRQTLSQAGVDYVINGHDYGADSQEWRVPGIINMQITGVENEWLLEAVDGVSFSTGSACSSGAQAHKPSHVLKAMGLTDEQARQSVRVSFGRFTTEEDIRNAAQIFADAVSAIKELAGSGAEMALAS